MLALSSDDEQARRELEAARALTMRRLARGVRDPLRPEEVQEHVRSSAFTGGEVSDGRMGAGEPEVVAGGCSSWMRRHARRADSFTVPPLRMLYGTPTGRTVGNTSVAGGAGHTHQDQP